MNWTWLTEDPTPVLVAGGLTLLVLIGMLWKTGRGLYLIAMGVVVFLMGGAVLIDYLVVTEREKVADVFYQAAKALESNDVNRVTPFLDPRAIELKQQAEQLLQQFELKKVRITSRPEVTINQLTSPPSAVAVFTASAEVQGHGGGNDFGRIPRQVRARLRLVNDRWLIYEATHEPIVGQ